MALLSACTLADLDGLSSGGVPATADGGAVSTEAGSENGIMRVDAGLEAGTPGYGDLVMQDHPVAYFPFDESSGASRISDRVSGKSASADSNEFVAGAPGIAGRGLRTTGHGTLDFGDMLDFVGRQP